MKYLANSPSSFLRYKTKRTVKLSWLWFNVKGTKWPKATTSLTWLHVALWPSLFAKKLQWVLLHGLASVFRSCCVVVSACWIYSLPFICQAQSRSTPAVLCLADRLMTLSLFFGRMCHSQAARIQIQYTSALGESDYRINERMDLLWFQESWVSMKLNGSLCELAM